MSRVARDTWRASVLRLDPVLAGALLLGFLFSVHGITWGRVECWNPDQMALRDLYRGMRPAGYAKPPFHTYLNHVLVLWPLDWAHSIAKRLGPEQGNWNAARLLGDSLVALPRA